MNWIELIGKLPVRLIVIMAALACGAFVVLVLMTVDSVYRTKNGFSIASYKFGVESLAPKDAVVAFAGPCPENDGWVSYSAGQGRVIVGTGARLKAGIGTISDIDIDLQIESKGGTTFQSIGHVLAPIDVNKLDPGGNLVVIVRNAIVTPERVSPQNLIQYQIMPPYVALQYCRKK